MLLLPSYCEGCLRISINGDQPWTARSAARDLHWTSYYLVGTQDSKIGRRRKPKTVAWMNGVDEDEGSLAVSR
jgi:hypothetical protein